MINHQKKRIAAIDIYRIGYQSNFWGGNRSNSKKFFIELRDAVINESITTGYCGLIDEILRQGKVKLDVVAYAALSDINNGFENNRLADVENDPRYKEYVPHVFYMGKKISWSECDMSRVYIIPKEEAFNVAYGVREVFRRYQIRNKAVEEQTTISAENKEKKESEKTVENAKEQAETIIAAAKAEADRIEKEANAEAEKIIEDAKARAKTMEEHVKEQVSAAAKEKAEKLIARYLTEEQKAYKTELNDEMRKFMDSYIENSSRAMSIHTEMCDATNAVQAKWIQALDDTINKMTEVKSEFYSHLHDWQVSLFPKEIKPLAERFLELYRILNVDKLIREEILLETLSDEKSEYVAETMNKKIDESEIRITGLQKLNKTLTTFLRRFELSLNGLDLYVYYPNPGDVFDEMWHIPDDEDEEYVGKRIKECIVPGIAKKANDDLGDDVLIPAVVKVEMES